MEDDDVWEPELVERREEWTEGVIAGLAARGWTGRISDLEPVALEAFWREALVYARWEIKQYRRWRYQDEPVLASGYDAEGLVQAAFGRLLSREAEGVPILYTAEGLRDKLRSQVKHLVRWLHERKETGLVVSEWDVLQARPDGELVSVFDYLPGHIASPDEDVIQKEKEELLGEFKTGFEKTLGKGRMLVEVLGGFWAGEKRREIARRMGMGAQRIRSLQAQVKRRLAKYAAQTQGAMAEMLASFRRC
jgi:hypothetical protein